MRIILIGFGKVGQSLAEMLKFRHEELRKNYGLNLKVVAIIDRGGAAISEKGISLSEALNAKKIGGSVSTLKDCGKPGLQALEVLEEVEGDVAVEVTPTNLETGEPGLSHIRKALTLGMHVVTTNKGPLALSLPSLVDSAKRKGVLLRFSGAVGSAIPVLDFAETCLYGDRIESIRGVLNGTTNYILWRIRVEDPLCVNSAFNAVEFKYAYSGKHIPIGPGAGAKETASSIINDIIHIFQKRLNSPLYVKENSLLRVTR